jgi:hypothetical protein
MPDMKPFDVMLEAAGDEAPDNEAMEALLPKEPGTYVLTSDQWGVIKQASEMMAMNALKEMNFPAFLSAKSTIEELIEGFRTTSEPRFTDNPDTDPAPDADVSVTLPVVIMVTLFAATHAVWHIANSGNLSFENPDTAAENLAMINETHARALAFVQPFTDHFNHDVDGNDL